MKDEPTIKFTAETTDKVEAKALTEAMGMKIAINSYYDDIIRDYLKYAELSEEKYKLVDEINDKLRDHFAEFIDDI